MRITIVGGGNIGTQFAAHCAEKNHEVIVFTSKPNLFSLSLKTVNEINVVEHQGIIKKATSDPIEAFKNAECIMVTVPASLMDQTANIVYDNAPSNALIGLIPGTGGGECSFSKCIDRGNIVFGLERVPSVARLVKYGEAVRAVGYRDCLRVASLPAKHAEKCSSLISSIFDMPCLTIPNYLNITMTPSNPILHTTRLRVIFKDYKEGVFYNKLPLFYEEWDDESSKLLFACDEEVQNICNSLREFDLSYVKSLKKHYDSFSVNELTKKITGIESLKGLETPSVKVAEGLIPNLHSRYFTSDFWFGLSIIKQIADFAGVDTPNINQILKWYGKIAIEKECFKYENYGINNYENFKNFYCQ